MKEKYNNVHRPLKKIVVANFVGGVAWGVGVTVGATVLLAILGFIVSRIDVIPFIGGFIADIVQFIETNDPRMVQ